MRLVEYDYGKGTGMMTIPSLDGGGRVGGSGV